MIVINLKSLEHSLKNNCGIFFTTQYLCKSRKWNILYKPYWTPHTARNTRNSSFSQLSSATDLFPLALHYFVAFLKSNKSSEPNPTFPRWINATDRLIAITVSFDGNPSTSAKWVANPVSLSPRNGMRISYHLEHFQVHSRGIGGEKKKKHLKIRLEGPTCRRQTKQRTSFNM